MRMLVSDLLEEAARLSKKDFITRHPSPVLVFLEQQEVATTPQAPFVTLGAVGSAPRAFPGDDPPTLPGLDVSRVAAHMKQTAERMVVRPIRKTNVNVYQTKIAVGSSQNNDVVLPHATVSGFHGFFQVRPDGAVTYTDAGSKHGTSAGWTPVEEGKPVTLKSGTEMRFGELVARFFDAEGLHAYLHTYASIGK